MTTLNDINLKSNKFKTFSTSDIASICAEALSCMNVLLRAGSPVPKEESFISSLWTIATNVISIKDLCHNTYRFISVMKMIKLSNPYLGFQDMLLDDSTAAQYPVLGELRIFLTEYSNNPVRLQDLCRIVIRRELKDSPDVHCKDLPVPQKLKDFVLFETV